MEAMALTITNEFRGKRVLVTGHTGFKGAWLCIWLEALGAKVSGISLDPIDDRCVFTLSGIGSRIADHRLDIMDLDGLERVFAKEQPEVVFHLAAQALVLESYNTPVETFAVNTLGTANVLEVIRRTPSVRSAVMVTTDKCYENREWVHGYRESDALGGYDPYSASKGAAEIVIASFRRSFFTEPGAAGIASARSGNVIGGGDRSADRLVPDLVRAVEAQRPLQVRHPGSIRPWQHVLEPVHGYLLLAARLLEDPVRFSGPWNFGPMPTQIHTVGELAEALLTRFDNGVWHEGAKDTDPHEAGLLLLDISKAVQQLGWEPRLSFQDTIRLTADWYKQETSVDILELCRSQIAEFNDIGSIER